MSESHATGLENCHAISLSLEKHPASEAEKEEYSFGHDLHKKNIKTLIYPPPWATLHPTESSSSKDTARSYYAQHPYT
jgi:hypothetical protein